MNSTALSAFVLIIILFIGGYFYWSKRDTAYSAITTFEECKAAGFPIMESYPEQCATPDGRNFVNTTQVVGGNNGATTTPNTSKDNLIQVNNIVPNQIISSPLTITGKARGYWYFEASFPVELRDGNGKQIAIKPAQAQGEWMTEEFVPFSVTLTFVKPTTATGTLILHKDNPSDRRDLDDSLRIPVRFSNSASTEKQIVLFYYNPNFDKDANGNILCSGKGLVPVTRTVAVTNTPIQDAIKLLLRGELTSTERGNEITTEYPLPGVTLTGASLNSLGNLNLSLTDPQNKTSGGACRVTILRNQIEATAKQFSEVKTVSFTPNTLFQP